MADSLPTIDVQKIDADGNVLSTVTRFDDAAQVAGIVAFCEASGAVKSTTTFQFRSDVTTWTFDDTVRAVLWNR